MVFCTEVGIWSYGTRWNVVVAQRNSCDKTATLDSFRNAAYSASCNVFIEFVTRVDMGINACVRCRVREGDMVAVDWWLIEACLGNQFTSGAASIIEIIRQVAADLSRQDLSLIMMSMSDLYLSRLLLVLLLTKELLADQE